LSQAGSAQVQSGNLPPDVATSYVTDSGTAIPVTNTLEILGTGGASTSAVGNIVYVNVTGAGYTWNIVTSSSPPNPIQIVEQNGYITSGSSQVTFLLPLSPNLGDTFKIFSLTSTFKIEQNANQKIVVGAADTTIGATGYLNSNSAGDEITITYLGSNTFESEAPQGTFTAN
jgi:hypothetical protein